MMRHKTRLPMPIVVRRRASHPPSASAELSRSIGALVETLAEARALAADGTIGPDLARLLDRARRELDFADEKLLMLDRYRQRSLFRRAERIRDRLDSLHHSVSRRVKPTH
jgi:hypothetical protein